MLLGVFVAVALFEVDILVRLQFFTSWVKDSTTSDVVPRCSLKTIPEVVVVVLDPFAAGDTDTTVEGVSLAAATVVDNE